MIDDERADLAPAFVAGGIRRQGARRLETPRHVLPPVERDAPKGLDQFCRLGLQLIPHDGKLLRRHVGQPIPQITDPAFVHGE